MTTAFLPKRILVGRPLSSSRMGETLLPKRLALPVFCSDPLSSNAYATEEILLVLSAGGLALIHLTPWLAACVVVVLLVVVASYRQTCYAYPSGGGAYAVSKANLGRNASLIAAAALLVDYVMTVAVSVAAGVANLVSAVPDLAPDVVPLSLALVAVLTLINLRGVKESGRAFAVPTYGFVVTVFLMIGVGIARLISGGTVTAESANISIAAPTDGLAGAALLFVVLRAFASGCTALTGVEAVSNGVPSFRRPKSHNAAATLAIMGALTVTMFIGITVLAMASKVHVAEDPSHLVGAPAGYTQRTVIAQIGGAVFGVGSPMFFIIQGFTTLVLVLAANTAYNGFPILASILGHDGFMPRQLSRRGDRLVFSNGVVILASAAAAMIVTFHASTTRLMQLYIIGVFVSFTLSQLGMVKHWARELGLAAKGARGHVLRARAINTFGALLTSVVLVVALVAKFTHGAWIVVVAIPVLVTIMLAVRRHYDRVDRALAPTPDGVPLPSRVHAVVLVSRLNAPTLRALAYARATRPSTLVALTVRTDPEDTDRLMAQWDERGVPVPLTALASPFRDITRPVVEHITDLRREGPRDVVAVYVPEFVLDRWWEHLLHNQTALRLKARLLFLPGVMVTSVPWRLDLEQPGPAAPPSSGTATTAGTPVAPAPARSAAPAPAPARSAAPVPRSSDRADVPG